MGAQPRVRQLEDRTVPTTFDIANSDGQVDLINLAQGGNYAFAQADNTTNGPNALPVIGAGRGVTTRASAGWSGRLRGRDDRASPSRPCQGPATACGASQARDKSAVGWRRGPDRL
jgi:hypothetical protein